MPKQQLSLPARRNKAYRLFLRGFSTSEIAEKVKVTEDTVRSYLKHYQDKLGDRIASNPDYLDRVIEHTFVELERLSDREKEAWERLENATRASDQTNLMNLIQRIGEQRAKILRLMDMRVEVVGRVERATKLQEALITYVQTCMCDECRRKLEEFLDDLDLTQKALPPTEIIGEIE